MKIHLTQQQLDKWLSKVGAMYDQEYDSRCSKIDKKITEGKELTADEYIFNAVSATGPKDLLSINFFLNGAKVPDVPEGQEKTV